MRTRVAKIMVILIAAFCAVAAQAKKPLLRPVTDAVPVERVISGNPLTIRIGDDTSFQVLNSTIGAVGQIFPGGCTNSVADAGIFAAIGGVLYAPNFNQHSCGSAAGGTNGTPWTPVSISNVSGNGSSGNPFTVTVVVDAGATGVRMTATYTYVNSDPFFRMTKVFTSTNAVSLNVYVGADIFLAGFDAGVPYLEPLSSSPGGRDCAITPTYTILLIPTTPANHYSARFYNTVWGEIGSQGNLTDIVATGCQDNGAAIQWQRNLLPGGTTTITSAVSFGPVPPIVQFNVASASPTQSCSGETLTVVINGIGFQSGTTFNFGPGITVTSTTINSSTQATVTISIASTATPGPRNIVGTQSSGGLTATLVNGFTVMDCPRCGRLTPIRVLCTTDGSGDYLITFTFQNLSTQTISSLYLLGFPSGVTATPNYVPLSPAVGPGGFATVGPIRIHGASPGVLTFTAMILNGELEECCDFEVRVELPRCDCAQIVESGNAHCRFPGGGYTYTFSYQNLFNGPISQLLITPDVPSTALYSPNVIPLNPPMQFGEIRTFTITITNAPASQAACFRITSERERDEEECCTIRRCVFLPRCHDFPDDDIHFLGDTVRVPGPGLTIQSASNHPAVSFDLPADTVAVDLVWEPLPAGLPNGAFVEQRYRGSVGNTPNAVLSSTRSVLTGTNTELRTRFDGLGASLHRFDFLRAGRVVGTKSGVPSDVPAICNCGPRLPTRDGHFDTRGLFAGYTFIEPNPFTLANLKFDADEVRVSPEGLSHIDLTLTAVDLEASGMPRISLTTLDVLVDCNGNGIDDFADIATGASLDTDGNGVPDECQGRSADLDLSLNTGFDQARGALLAAGSDDAEWQVKNASVAGAAKVVRNPAAAWGSALPRSAWISVLPDKGDSISGLTTLQFENCFCIGDRATGTTLDLDVRADNSATVYLNDAKVAGAGGAFNGAPLAVHVTGAVGGAGPFRVGRNCVRIDVEDSGIVTGLDAAGSVRARNGACR